MGWERWRRRRVRAKAVCTRQSSWRNLAGSALNCIQYIFSNTYMQAENAKKVKFLKISATRTQTLANRPS